MTTIMTNKTSHIVYIINLTIKMINLTPKLHLWWPWGVSVTSICQNNIRIWFLHPKTPWKDVLHMLIALLVFYLWFKSYPGGGHIGFCQYGGPGGRSSWRPSKIERVLSGRHVDQIWCFWKNLNQISLRAPNSKCYISWNLQEQIV